jgi:hypothetical protein
MKNIMRATIGCLLLPLYHFPRLGYEGVLVSFDYVFNRHENLTASPKEHLRRAKKLLQGQNSQLLYAALELRFALERMTQWELIYSAKASERVLDDPDPVKKLKALRRIDGETSYEHKIFLRNPTTNELIEWGRYKPLDQARVSEIDGRLGNLLHPKEGLPLGIWNDPWYVQTRSFLLETHDYLSAIVKDNISIFSVRDLSSFEVVKVGE